MPPQPFGKPNVLIDSSSSSSNRYALAKSETIKNCRIWHVSRIYLSNLFVLILGSPCFHEKVSVRNKRL